MVRAPCCDKMGLKKGPWTSEEDRILISYIEKNGHGNWRALPKLAGLSRCGKSCRLRWINYLRPDIKRGNFTKEEEETIIELHQMLGNRWSTIAAKLLGRTDNEIKNVWHTHLRKRLRLRLKQQSSTPECGSNDVVKTESSNLFPTTTITISVPPQPSLREISSMTEASVVAGEVTNIVDENIDNIVEYSLEPLPMIDESFWSDFNAPSDNFSMHNNGESRVDQNYIRVIDIDGVEMDFWYDLFVEAEGAHELRPKF